MGKLGQYRLHIVNGFIRLAYKENTPILPAFSPNKLNMRKNFLQFHPKKYTNLEISICHTKMALIKMVQNKVGDATVLL